MGKEGLSAHVVGCLEHLKEARALGTSVAAYARAKGLKARMLYDAEKRLKKSGAIGVGLRSAAPGAARAGGAAESSESRFVSVRVEQRHREAMVFLPVLRVQHVRGHVLEFGSWPPAEVLAAALSGRL